MKKRISLSGFILIAAGVLTLGSCLLPHDGSMNRRLIVGLAIVFAGVVMQVYIIKKQSRY